MLKKFSAPVILLSIILILTGCPAIQEDPNTNQGNNNPSDKAIQTIEWVTNSEDQYCQFYTNDKIYSGLNGSTVYHLTNQEAVMTTVVTEAIKNSGKSKYSYGIIFCGKENIGETSPDKKYDFYTVTIYTDKSFRIAKRVLGEWKIIQAKTSNAFLYEVTEGVNIVKVINNGAGNFTLSFNGHEAAGEPIPFTDNTLTPLLTGGYYGYIAEIGKDESFPNTPVDVKFKQTSPAL